MGLAVVLDGFGNALGCHVALGDPMAVGEANSIPYNEWNAMDHSLNMASGSAITVSFYLLATPSWIARVVVWVCLGK